MCAMLHVNENFTMPIRFNTSPATLKEQAATRLKGMKHVRKAECAPNRVQAARLAVRVADWERMQADPLNKNKQAFIKPGSMSK